MDCKFLTFKLSYKALFHYCNKSSIEKLLKCNVQLPMECITLLTVGEKENTVNFNSLLELNYVANTSCSVLTVHVKANQLKYMLLSG